MTYDVLTSVYRMEKNSTALSQIRKDFYTASQELLIAQNKECERLVMENPDSVIYDGAMSRKKNMIDCLKKIVDLRMNKIVSMAVRGAEGANNVIEMLTQEEKEYYLEVLAASKRIWSNVDVKKKKPVIPDITVPPVKHEPEAAVPEVKGPVREETVKEEPPVKAPEPVTEDIPLSEIPFDDEPPAVEEEQEPESEDELLPEEPVPIAEEPVSNIETVEEPTVILRILQDLPPMSGPERNYNLKKEDVVRMPSIIAQALINRGLAVIIPMS